MGVAEHDDDGGVLVPVFRALANGERLAVLRVLRACAPGGLNISQVAAAAELNRFTASRHLKALCAVGLATAVKRNQSTIHRIDPHGFDMVEDWLYETAPAVDAQRFG